MKTPARNITTVYALQKNIMPRASESRRSLKGRFYHPLRSRGGAHAFQAYSKTGVDHPSSPFYKVYRRQYSHLSDAITGDHS